MFVIDTLRADHLGCYGYFRNTSPTINRLAAEGRHGIKTGAGLYEYEPGARDEILRKRDLYCIRQLKLIREIQQGLQAPEDR